jgi:hypothetical protein
VLSQGVQERVGRGIVGLPGIADDPGHRGEQDERVQFQVLGELVQVPGAVNLGPQHGVEAVLIQRLHRAVSQHTRRVDHRRQRVLGRNIRQNRGELVPIRHIACGHGDVGAQGGELRLQFGRASPAAGQN